MLLRAADAAAPPISAALCAIPHHMYATSATGWEKFRLDSEHWSMFRREDPASVGWECPRPIIEGVGHDKLYLEFTIENITGEVATTSVHHPWFYVRPFGESAKVMADPDAGFPTTTFTTGRLGIYGYSRRGRWSENGVVTAVEDAAARLTIGDIVGIGVDVSATPGTITWYKNGTLVRTTSLATDARLTHLVAGAGWGDGGSTATTQNTEMSFNVTGPFDGRLPSGYNAWDWPNEVT